MESQENEDAITYEEKTTTHFSLHLPLLLVAAALKEFWSHLF